MNRKSRVKHRNKYQQPCYLQVVSTLRSRNFANIAACLDNIKLSILNDQRIWQHFLLCCHVGNNFLFNARTESEKHYIKNFATISEKWYKHISEGFSFVLESKLPYQLSVTVANQMNFKGVRRENCWVVRFSSLVFLHSSILLKSVQWKWNWGWLWNSVETVTERKS